MFCFDEHALRRVNQINCDLSVGKDEVLRVLCINKIRGFIDLSKKQVKPDEIKEIKKNSQNQKILKKLLKNYLYILKNLWNLYINL